MARTKRDSNFPQLGGPGVQYQKAAAGTGEPKLNKRGNPELAWKFPGGSPELILPAERQAAIATVVHSIETAPAHLIESGSQWYPEAHDIVSKGVRKRGFLSGAADKHLSGSALVASLSPGSDWDAVNRHVLGDLSSLKPEHWDTIMAARTGSSRAALRTQRAARDIVRGTTLQDTTVPNLQKAGRLVRGEDPSDVISYASAPKTHSFMQNIHDPSNPNFVTIDARAWDTMTNRMRPWQYSGRNIGGATGTKSPPGRYVSAGNVMRSAASAYGLDPSAAQGVSWSNVKYDVEQLGGKRKQGPTRIGQPYFHPETGEIAAHMPHLAGAQFLGR